MSSSSGGSGSTASMREEEEEGRRPSADQVRDEDASDEQQEHQHHHQQRNEPADCVSDASPASVGGGAEEESREDEWEAPEQTGFEDTSTEENKMTSNVVTIDGSEAMVPRAEQNVSLVEKNGGKSFGGGRVERSGFENLGYVDDEAHSAAKGSVVGSGGKVLNGGGGGGYPQQSPSPPRPLSPAGPFLESVVAVTPTPSGGVNGRHPVLETPNLSIHNTSGLIMTPNDKEKSDMGANVTEAVNLELVNMNPYGGAGLGVSDEVARGKSGANGGLNGIPVKRGASDEETGDGGFSDPYDEYFVPVNEHRKYIRGEKLYVTKDRRRSQSWRRCICWAVGFTLLAVAILIAVLAGTGIILAQEDEGKSVEARSFGGADSIPHVAESKDPNAPDEKDNFMPLEESSSYTPPPSLSSVPITPPTTQMNTFNVPRVLEAEMTIDSLSFEPDLLNSSSSQFKELSSILEKELKLALFDGHSHMNGPADIFIKVISFQSGSIVAKFHIGWRFKESFPMARDPIDTESLKDQIEAYLLNNGGYLYVYHIAPGTLKSNHVLDQCQVDNGGCSHECKYNYEEAYFACSCPPGLYLDNLKKTCLTEFTDVTTTTTSTQVPLYEDSPWMPIQPKELEIVPERVEPESGHDESGKVNHDQQNVHEEANDRDNAYENHHDHIYSVFTNTTEENSETKGLETADEEHKMDDSSHSEPEMKESVEEKNQEDTRYTLSAGMGRSNTGESILIEDSSEEPHGEDEHENDTENEEELHTDYKEEQVFRGHNDNEPSRDGSTLEKDSEEKTSGEEMEKSGHTVDSSENTPLEVHDSEEIDGKGNVENSEMSKSGEIAESVDDGYDHSSHSLLNELHVHTMETTTSENLHVNALEPNESINEFKDDQHIFENKTLAPDDVRELSKVSDSEVGISTSKEEMVPAVEYATVKDENETLELIDGGTEEEEKVESGDENSSESDAFGMNRKEVGDNTEEGHSEEKITSEESPTNDDEEGTEKPNEVMHGEEHTKDGMLEENAGNIKENDTVEHRDMGVLEPEDEKSVESDKYDDMIEHHVEMVHSDIHEMDHEIGGMIDPNEDEMVIHAEGVSGDAGKPVSVEALNLPPVEVEDKEMSEENDKNGESHVSVVMMHDENDVGNHEIDPKTVKTQGVVDVVVDGSNEETGRGMKEHVEEITQKSPVGTDHTVELGTDTNQGVDLSAMNHEKEKEDVNNEKILDSNENFNIGITPVMIDHLDSVEENSKTEMESSTASMSAENEADTGTENINKKEMEHVWEKQSNVKEMDGSKVHSMEENLTEGGLNIGHDGNESPAVELEVSTKENKTIFKENAKEMEEGSLLVDFSSEKSTTVEEMMSDHMKDAVTASPDDGSLSNVLEGADDVLKSKDEKPEPDKDSEHTVSPEEDKKFGIDDFTTNVTTTPISNVDSLMDDEDPNIVPIEENAKEMIGDDFDAKQISPAIEVKIMGLDEDQMTTTEEKHANDVPTTNVDLQDTSEIVLTTQSEGIVSENQNKTSEMPLDNKMEVEVVSSTTASTAENGIENVSNQYNSSNEANVVPLDNPYEIEHAAIVMNESSVMMATPSPKENNIDDPPLHLQAGMSVVVSEESSLPSTSTSEPVIEKIVPISNHKVKSSLEDDDSKNDANMTDIVVISENKEKAGDTEENVKEEVLKDIEHVSLTSSELSSEKTVEKEEKMVEGDAAEMEIVDKSSEKSEDRGKSIPDSKDEEVSSISTITQDFNIEDANTVHALSPTPPSTITNETPKTESISDTIIPKSLDNADIHPLDGSISKDESIVPESHLPFETDDNERSNNLATLDNEDSLSVPEGGNEAIVKVGAVDIGLKSTTEHMNEILAIPVFNTWPGTALEANNLTHEAEKASSIKVDGHEVQSENLEEKGDAAKINSFEIPMKKKGEFKKPIHPEEDITKSLFGKEGKESSSKVDKIGLLSPMLSSTANNDFNAEMNSEEMVDLLITTTEMPYNTEQNGETERILDIETGFTSSSSLTEKGREKLNTIGESQSSSKKDLGKVLGKETTKEGELASKSEERKEEDISAINITTDPELTTLKHEGILINDEGDGKENTKEIVLKSDESIEGEMNSTDVIMTEEVTATTVLDEEINFSENKSVEPVSKEEEEVTLMADDGTTRVNIDEMESVVPTTTEKVQEKVQELLKEMGGYGEGGHKVVSKSGVELFADPPKEIHTNSSTSENISSSVSSSSTPSTDITSDVNPITSSPIRAEVENQLLPSLPPSEETTKFDINNKLEVNVTDEEIIQNKTDVLEKENTNSDSSITMMIHEIVSSESSSPNSVSSTVPSTSTAISSAKDGEEITTTNEMMEMTTLNSMLDNAMETMKPDSVDFTTLRQPEILSKENSSSIADNEDIKEVDAVNVMDVSHIVSNVSESENGSSVKTWLETEQNSTGNASNITVLTLPEIDQQFFSKCTSGQFQCTNGTSLTPQSVMPISSSYVASLATGVACVPLSAKCDSINDCSDGSDELGCIEEGCPGNFQCSNSQCLKRHLVCNGIIDCNDASDEANCEKWQCQFDEFQCPSGRCIPVLWLCDGKPDCDNHTDEYTCQESCGNNEYLCPEGWCIPMSWRCNGIPECANGEDEKLCDCSLEQVKCGTGGCVARAEVCDGVDHCPDQSDEWGCVRLHNETMKLEVRTIENKWLSVCADRWDNNWSNFVCQSFGYSRGIFTEYPAAGDLDGSSEVFILKPDASIMVPLGNSIRLPGVLQQASSSLCSSGSIVEISCQEFTCGNHGLADGVAARLVGGDEAANGQWPSVALLYHTRHRSTCTASIISPRWLIASYNCLHTREKSLSPEGWVAFGGGSTFDKDKPETQIQSVRSIVPYPQVKYNRFLYNHDVALVELMEPLAFTQSVGAICLPEKPIEPRQLCVTAGWGYTSPGEINFSQYLHYLPVPTIDLNECNSSKHYAGFITEDKICAGFTDAMHSPCYNDEGAPLMCVSEGGIWELQGVLSYHSNCGRGYHPSIFSSVTAVRDWMKKVVGGRFERRSTFNVRRRRRRSRNGYERTANIIWS